MSEQEPPPGFITALTTGHYVLQSAAFVAIVLPALFVLGLFTSVRLVDSNL